ncbi:PREDICTED: amyotrophic lateral sclerosis 2 chromosomal region candidate gene 11 protein [Bison bison bison]|uniref:Amyotrophic lateral sclerosis 2 chromosomal region candidate gene 11 protein n=1 Tax=Bison bison bison TaxID=43346 RepID=A0A6P3IY82_BISBB|nr:PREDICTED: amyotrophic lateral sclerosis 2 chromosomal region candidate gene 11 protein [Bison bison bison]
MEPPQDMEKVSNAEDNHNRRVHSLYTAPLFQRISQTNLENMQARGSEFSSTAWNVQGRDKPSNLSKVESKEGPGYRLLNMLRKTLKGSENKAPEVTHEAPSLVPFGDVVGCLAIHIRNCKHFTPKIISQHYSNLFIRISINNVVKCTKTCSLLSQNTEKDIMITFDEVKYFSVQVPRRQDDEKNNIRLELMQHDNTKKYLLLLGSVQVHLYEVIQKGCFTGELQVLNKNTFICRVEVEFMFSYGNFGYGFSHQLKPLQKIIKPSMFMDIAPPPERTDPVTNVIIPQPIAYPAFLSPDLNVTVGVPATSQSNQPSVVQLEKLQQQPRERLEKMKKEYRHLSTWAEKASYLEGLLTPGLEHKEPKESNINEIPESQLEERPTDTVTSGVSLIKEEAETIPSELLDNDDKKGLSLPTLNQSSKDDSSVVAPKTDMPSKETDTPLSTIPRLSITEENQIPPLEEHQQEAMPVKKMKNLFFLPEEKLKDRYPSLLKTDLHPSESSPSYCCTKENLNRPCSLDELMQDKACGQKNTNRKGKSVVFSPKEYISPCFKPEYTEFKPAYQKFNIKNGFDPFLRNINNKMSVQKRKDQDMLKCRNILSAEIIEHEDQDPPYPTHSKTSRPASKTWPHNLDIISVKALDTKNNLAGDVGITTVKTSHPMNNVAHDPGIITIKTLDTKNNLAHHPSITTIKTLDAKNMLQEKLPHVSLPNFEGDSSVTGKVNVHKCRLSKSLSLTSHIENLKQSMVLKSILSKNLQDLSDRLFSTPGISMDPEARKKSYSSPLLVIHDEQPSSLEDKVFEKSQDLSNWHSEGGILNSKSLLSQIIKNIPPDSLSEGRPGNSPEAEEEPVSEKHLQPGEIDFPTKKKSSFKKKHSKSEISSSKPDLNSLVYDYVIKQIFTAPIFSELAKGVKEASETQIDSQRQLPTAWESSLSSSVLVPHYEESNNEIEFPPANSVISQIIQAFPVDTLLESGIIKVIELDQEYQKGFLLDTETAFAEEKPKDSTEEYSEIRGKAEPLSDQNSAIIHQETTSSFKRVEFIDKGQNTSPHDSKYQSTPDKKSDLPSNNGQRLDREENDTSSTLENLCTSLTGKLNDSDVIMLKSFLKNIFNFFFKYNQSENRPPEKELERLIQHPFQNKTEDLEEIEENFDTADKLDRKPVLNPKLRIFLEELSESEIKNLKSELSKHVQHYLVEKLSESGHITKEDLPKIYQNLYLMNEKVEPKGQNIFLEKYSETVKEIMSFVNNFNHHFIDKHLEIKLRSFLNEVLQNYFLKNLSDNSLFKETESDPMCSKVSSLRAQSASVSFQELGQDTSSRSFGSRLEINMKYPLSKSLQSYLIALSENEILDLKADLSKHLQSLFIEKLSKSGLITERQLKGISQHINLVNFSSTPLKCIKPDLSLRDENQFVAEHSDKQNKYSKIAQKTTLQKAPEERLVETELTKKEEKEVFSLENIKENPPIIQEQKRHSQEAKILRSIKVKPCSNKNTQVIPLNKSSERLTDTVPKKKKKEHGFMQFPHEENFEFKTESQDQHNWNGKSKITQSKACFEKTLKMKSLDKKDHCNTYKLMVQEKPEAVLSPYQRIPNCKMPNEDEEYVNKFTFPSRQNNNLTCLNSEAGEKSKLEDQYCQRLKGNNNNNKKQHLEIFTHYKEEIQTLYTKPNELCNEKYAWVPESQLLKILIAEKNSKPSLFPEVLKRENLKPKVRKERDRVSKQKKSFNKIDSVLPTTPPSTGIHLRKSVPRTLLHWTARRTTHDCSDRFEELHVTSFKHLENAKSRARLLEKSPDDSHNQFKRFARPYTAPEVNKRGESYTGKFTSPRMVSAGLVHINDSIPEYEIHKMRPKKKIKREY